MPYDDEVATQLRALAGVMTAVEAGQVGGQAVVRLAAVAVPSAEHAALTYIRGTERPRTLAATGDVPLRVDEIQYATGEGPCLAAIRENDLTRATDLATDTQWPEFAARAVAETPVRSMFGVRLFLDRAGRGALNFYAGTPGAFTDVDLAVGAVLAAYAAVALDAEIQRQQASGLREALTTNRQIGLAMGILMSSQQLTEDQAFARLREASQHLNRKLHDIAAEVNRTGRLPDRTAAG